jgi:hypothetical protein
VPNNLKSLPDATTKGIRKPPQTPPKEEAGEVFHLPHVIFIAFAFLLWRNITGFTMQLSRYNIISKVKDSTTGSL